MLFLMTLQLSAPPPAPKLEQYLSNCYSAALQRPAAVRCEELGLEPPPVDLNHSLIKGEGSERRVILYRADLSELRATAAQPPKVPPYRYQGAELKWVQAQRQREALTRCAQGLSQTARRTEVNATLLQQLPGCPNLYGARPTLRTEGLRWTQAQLELTAPLADGTAFR